MRISPRAALGAALRMSHGPLGSRHEQGALTPEPGGGGVELLKGEYAASPGPQKMLQK